MTLQPAVNIIKMVTVILRITSVLILTAHLKKKSAQRKLFKNEAGQPNPASLRSVHEKLSYVTSPFDIMSV